MAVVITREQQGGLLSLSVCVVLEASTDHIRIALELPPETPSTPPAPTPPAPTPTPPVRLIATDADLVGEAIDLAVLRFGGTDGVFNAAGVSAALSLLFRLQEAIDGQRIHAFLVRRPDVACLGPSMYRRLRGPLPKE